MAPRKKSAESVVEVQEVSIVEFDVRIIGTTPLFQNRMSAKVLQGLLVGSKKKTAAERAQIKHNPLEEFRASAETVPDGPTALGIKVVAIKAAMCDAAIETAGLTKAGTQRLLYMPGSYATLYGVPQLRMDVVRSADINKTPDVRTRAFLPKWGAEFRVGFVTPQLSTQAVATLLSNAGILIGIGDFRQQKGKGAYGSFRIATDEDQAEWDSLVETGGRKQQLAALESPEYADDETAELMAFWEAENRRRSA